MASAKLMKHLVGGVLDHAARHPSSDSSISVPSKQTEASTEAGPSFA
jgi:hypothetical protein